ncbi:26352_t:CDS:2, partial [Racocetra persica]
LPLFPLLFDTEDGCNSIADTYKPEDYFNCSNIHETQWKTDVGESRHLKVEEQPYFNDTKLSLFSLFDIENDYSSIIDTYESKDKFNQLETYNERLQATDIELPCLNEPPNVKENSDDENTEESGPLYLVAQKIDFKSWKELTNEINKKDELLQ